MEKQDLEIDFEHLPPEEPIDMEKNFPKSKKDLKSILKKYKSIPDSKEIIEFLTALLGNVDNIPNNEEIFRNYISVINFLKDNKKHVGFVKKHFSLYKDLYKATAVIQILDSLKDKKSK